MDPTQKSAVPHPEPDEVIDEGPCLTSYEKAVAELYGPDDEPAEEAPPKAESRPRQPK